MLLAQQLWSLAQLCESCHCYVDLLSAQLFLCPPPLVHELFEGVSLSFNASMYVDILYPIAVTECTVSLCATCDTMVMLVLPQCHCLCLVWFDSSENLNLTIYRYLGSGWQVNSARDTETGVIDQRSLNRWSQWPAYQRSIYSLYS